MTAASSHDIIIMGGGLAGLTLALQLRRRDPTLDVLVLERRAHPVPVACHKVGESSVEIGAHYFEQVLGLKPHLDEQQLRKFGFRFFFSEGAHDIASVTELGASRPLPTPSYQIDRGVFENYLAAECRRQGVGFVDGALIRTVALSEDEAPHVVQWQRPGEAVQSSSARWAIDACGRAGMLKRQLGLARDNDHGCHAVWFRIRDRICIDDWSADAAWRGRCVTPTRWLSTNHLVGAGYWVWLIPLSSGSHSVGIVADPRHHPFESMNSFDKAMAWLARYQPALHADLHNKRDALQDFAFLRRFSYDCTQVFSAKRWALAGEAGRFLDPFYSPGSDFIAIGNTYITELVARDRAGQPLAAHVQLYEQIFRSFYDSTLALYTDQYGLFGDPEVLPTKVIWDYTYYWSVLAPLFFHQRLADLATLSHLREELLRCKRLNGAVQEFLRAWGEVSEKRNLPIMLDQAGAPWFVELNRGLRDPLDAEAFRARVRAMAAQLESLAAQIVQRATREHPQLDASALLALLPPGAAKGSEEPLLFAPLHAPAMA